ncbi:MAG: toll/interleukin-1 receptor domain-containing protein, partial [Myxococcales bacterium]|nr:toll/interleukin-1 receptor domain-containing protein [Myxococcales bacterium]
LPIDYWHDRHFFSSATATAEIYTQLEVADVVILLISPDFMASDYCFSKEMVQALQKYEKDRGVPVPIIIRPESTWHQHQIGQHQALPRDGRAISKWPDPDDAWENVTQGLQALLEDLARKRR